VFIICQKQFCLFVCLFVFVGAQEKGVKFTVKHWSLKNEKKLQQMTTTDDFMVMFS